MNNNKGRKYKQQGPQQKPQIHSERKTTSTKTRTNSERKEKPHKDRNEGRTNNRQPNGRKHRIKQAMDHKHKHTYRKHPQKRGQLKFATYKKNTEHEGKGREDNTDDRKRRGQHERQAQIFT